MMFANAGGLGMIPSWQFDTNPAINPKINPNVVYPAGMTQTSIQPTGSWLNGLGAPKSGVQFLGLVGKSPIQFLGPKNITLLGFRGFGDITDTVSSIGSFLMLALAAYGGYTAFKKISKR